MQHLQLLMIFCSGVTAYPVAGTAHRQHDTTLSPAADAAAQLPVDMFRKREPTFGMLGGMGGGMGGMPGLAGLGGLGGMSGGGTAGATPGVGDPRAQFMAMIAKFMKGMAGAGAGLSPNSTPTLNTTLPEIKPVPHKSPSPDIPAPDPAGDSAGESMRKRQFLPVTMPGMGGTGAQRGAGNLVNEVGKGLGVLLPGPLGAGLMSLLGGVGKEIASGLPPPGRRLLQAPPVTFPTAVPVVSSTQMRV